MRRIDIKMTPKQVKKLDEAIVDRKTPFALLSQPTMNTGVFKILIMNESEYKRLAKYMKRFIPFTLKDDPQ